VSVWSGSTENADRRLRRMAMATLLLALLAVLPAADSCTWDGDGLSTSSSTTPGGSTGGGASNGGDSTQGGLGPGGSDPVEAVDWGPVLLTAGALEDFTVRDGIGVGRVACDVGKATERTYVYALDVRNGTLIGTAEIPGRCFAVDIGARYAFLWAEEGISVHDLTQDFAHVQTWDDRFVSDIGSYL